MGRVEDDLSHTTTPYDDMRTYRITKIKLRDRPEMVHHIHSIHFLSWWITV